MKTTILASATKSADTAAPSPLAMSRPPLLQRKCACGDAKISGEGCEECREEGATLQRRIIGAEGPALAPPVVNDALRSQGQPLATELRNRMEVRFGHDFSRVRVHTDRRAGSSADAVGAEAYTVGPRIVFANGRYRPGSREGEDLVAHELAHVVQQSGVAVPLPGEQIPVAPVGDRLEIAAELMATGALQQSPDAAPTSTGPQLQRRPFGTNSDGNQWPSGPDLSPSSGPSGPGSGPRDPSSIRPSRGTTLPYRQATELAECVRIMGEENSAYCRQVVLGEGPQSAPTTGTPSVDITAADLGTGTNIELGPSGSQGTLVLELVGAGGNHQVATGPRSAGNVSESFNVPALPTREFTELRARWSVRGTDAFDTHPFHIDVLGVFRHSQYNIPHENRCGGAQVDAYVTDGACTFTPTTLRQRFFNQVNLNGSGVSMNHGNLTREAFCLNHQNAPADAQGRSFRMVQAIRGGCRGNNALNNATVAACRGRAELGCGTRVFIDTQGVKTVTDFCPGCCGDDQLDNFTTDTACAGIVDLGNFMTVRLLP